VKEKIFFDEVVVEKREGLEDEDIEVLGEFRRKFLILGSFDMGDDRMLIGSDFGVLKTVDGRVICERVLREFAFAFLFAWSEFIRKCWARIFSIMSND
jgi:hypothetical protein